MKTPKRLQALVAEGLVDDLVCELKVLVEASLAHAAAAFPDAADIYEPNVETLRTLGLAGWQALGVDAPPRAGP